jgi:hypothetical protein
MASAKRVFLATPACGTSDFDTFKGIYRRYKWPIGQVVSNIHAGFLTPLFPPACDASAGCKASCSICYQYFPRTNETQCCSHHICTECIAATVDPPGGEQICPFCRKPTFFVIANLSFEQLKTKDGDDSQYEKFEQKTRVGFDFDNVAGCCDEAIAIALQYKGDACAIHELMASGISSDEIISSIVSPPQPPTDPQSM